LNFCELLNEDDEAEEDEPSLISRREEGIGSLQRFLPKFIVHKQGRCFNGLSIQDIPAIFTACSKTGKSKSRL
jgi:hypothetical protein